MKYKWAVALFAHIDGTLELKVVCGENWREALRAAFADYADHCGSDDYDEARNNACNQDWQFEVALIGQCACSSVG